MLTDQLVSFDERREVFIGSNSEKAIAFAVDQWVHCAERAIQQRGRFVVALSGGSTPKTVYEQLILKPMDWSKVFLFWSDERAVLPNDSESNYHMAMASFQKVPIPRHQIFRMEAEKEVEKNAKTYEEAILKTAGPHLFDLVLLGIGEDGHTASLFPDTKGLKEEKRLVIGNFISEKNVWRMSLTFACINQSRKAVVYALGKTKREIVSKVLNAPIESPYPASKIGTVEHPALLVLDFTPNMSTC